MKRYIITFKEEVDIQLIEFYGGTIKYNYNNFKEKASIVFPEEYLNDLLLNENILKIEESKKCGISAGIYSYANNFRLVETSTFHKQEYTGNNVKIAILDTGIGNHGFLPSIPSLQWKDFVNGQSSFYDDNWHGTFIAGIVHGNAPHAILYIGKVLGDDTLGIVDDFIAGIDWAIDNNIDIINFSIVAFEESEELLNACRTAYDYGIIITACTGNGTHNGTVWNWVGTNYVYSPASDYSTIGVGACDVDGNITPYSNYGSGMDIIAPGGLNTSDTDKQLISTAPDDQYYYGYGTSFATAFVTAHCACLKEKYPSYDRADIVDKILSTARNGILRAEPLWHSTTAITYNSAKIRIRYLSYPTSQYNSFRLRISGTTNWITFTSGDRNYADAYNGYDGQYYTSTDLKFSNLQSNTTYTLEVEINWDGIWYSRPNVTFTTTIGLRPPQFYWDTPKISGQIFDVKATEWNRLIQNTKDMHIYKLGSYNPSLYPMTNVSSGQQFYASRFNELRFAIGSLNSTGINNKYKGDTLFANELNNLKDKLNQID